MEKEPKLIRDNNKKKWFPPTLKELEINRTLGGPNAGDVEGSTYSGTISA